MPTKCLGQVGLQSGDDILAEAGCDCASATLHGAQEERPTRLAVRIDVCEHGALGVGHLRSQIERRVCTRVNADHIQRHRERSDAFTTTVACRHYEARDRHEARDRKPCWHEQRMRLVKALERPASHS